jgi:hypothetical protein
MARVKVQLYGKMGFVIIETHPEQGAVLGESLFYGNRVLRPEEILNSAGSGNTTFIASGSSGGGPRPPVGSRIRSTDELDEGRFNLYFTDERAQDAVGAALTSSANVTLTYNDGSNTITADLTNTTVTPGTYGDVSHFPVVSVDAKGRVTGITLQAISGGGVAVWGTITGTLSDQADLQAALDERRSAAKRGAAAATTAPLPSCTYANGTAGVGATLTATANGAITVDGVGLSTGDVLLVKDQAADLENGPYVVTDTGTGATPFILTRDTCMDQNGELVAALVSVGPEGTANGSTLWICTSVTGSVVGTSPITFAQFTGGATYTDTGIMFSNGSLDASASAVGTTVADELRTMSVGTYNYAAKDWYLWVDPIPTTGDFELDVFLRGFGNTAPDTADSICGTDYPALAGNGTDFTESGDTTGWAGTAIGVGDMLVVRPRTNTAGVKHWVFLLKVRRNF